MIASELTSENCTFMYHNELNFKYILDVCFY